MKNNPLLMTDGYKTSHRQMYPEGTTLVYSNYTCRSTKRMPDKAKDVVVFGVQYMVKYIHDLWRDNFFDQPKLICDHAKQVLSEYLGSDYDVSHFEALHDLGYLPIEINSLPEGSVIKEGIPLFTIHNTHPDFFWVTNFLETLISTVIWKPVHSASLAYAFKKQLLNHAEDTGMPLEFCDVQGHDFSFRGMQSPESAIGSAMGFLTSFKGTDTIPAIDALKYYYNGEDIGYSVPASEHSVMCAHGQEGEIETLRFLMKKYPTGILSIVSDTWDLWRLITEYLPLLKDEIIARDGKIVIRPDSGNPVDILCGNSNALYGSSEWFGVVELLWSVFGGTVNEKKLKILNSHIGVIYGDAITIEREQQIYERLKAKHFANQVVYGIGSYSLGYATRDNQGGAVKSTYVEVNGEGRNIFKNPITDSGEKKSAKGLLAVYKNDSGEFDLVNEATWAMIYDCKFQTVYRNGNFYNFQSLSSIRAKLSHLPNPTNTPT